MAPLTWRNVSAPDFQGAASMMETASRGWDRAFSGLNEALQRQGEVNRRNRSAELLPMLANVTDQESAEAAIAAVGQLAPHQISPELAQAVMGLRNQAQEYQANQLSLAAARRSGGTSGASAGRQAAQDQVDAVGVVSRLGAITGQYPSGEPSDTPAPTNGRALPAAQTVGSTPLSFGSLEASSSGNTQPEPVVPGRNYSDRPTALQHTDLFGMGPNFRAGDMLARGLQAAGIDPGNPSQPAPQAQPAVAPVVASAAPQLMSSGQLSFGQPDNSPLPQPAAQPQGNYNPGTIPGSSNPQPLVVPQIPGTPGVPNRMPLAEELRLAATPIVAEAQANPNSDPSDTLNLLDNTTETIIERREAEDQEISRSLGIAQESFDLQRAQIAAERGEEARLRNETAASFVDDNYLLFNDRAHLVEFLGGQEGVTPDFRDAILSAWDGLPSERFILPEPDPVLQRTIENAATAADADTEILLGRNPLLRAIAEGSGEESSRQSNLDFLNRISEGEVAVDRTQVLAEINRVSQETGLALPLVHAAVENSLVQGTFLGFETGDLRVDSDLLLRNLEVYSDPGMYRDMSIWWDERQSDQDRLGVLGTRLLESDQRIRRLQDQLPESEWGTNPAMQAILSDQQSAQEEYDAITSRFEMTEFDRVPGWGPEDNSASVAESAAEEESRRREVAANTALEAATRSGSQIPSLGGYLVDPNASAADQAFNRSMRESVLNGSLVNINADLATSGASPFNRAWGTVSDFFRPAAVAAENQANRAMLVEASDWYSSRAAELVFRSNPGLLARAQEDPLGFYLRMGRGDQDQ